MVRISGRLRRRAWPQPCGDAGVSLVETIVAMVLLAGVSLAVVSGLLLASKVSGTSRDRVIAANLAAEQVEYLRAVGVDKVLAEPATKSVPVKSRMFSVATQAEWQSAPASSGDRCAGLGTGGDLYLKTSVAVSWPNMGSAQPARSDTLLTPRGGTGTSSSVRVVLRDRTGAGLSSRTVTLAPLPTLSPVSSAVTDTYGCALFGALADGTYRVTVNEPGYTATTGFQGVTQDVQIDNAQSPPVVFLDYDLAGGLTVRFADVPGFAQPTSTDVGFVLAHPGLRPVGSVALSTTAPIEAGAATTATALRLFPFATPYQGWFGQCRDADPAAYGGQRDPVTVTPGTPASSNVQSLRGGRATIDVLYRRNSQQALPQANVTLRATNASGTCTHAFDLGVTDSTGRLKVHLPYGQWRITPVARDLEAGTTAPTGTLTVGSPEMTGVIYTKDNK